MAKDYRRSFKMYPAWNYEEEIKDLNAASEKGWQLVRGGCFNSKFVNNPYIRYRYQMDYRKIDDMGRYIETFREQGWEYINSTFNGWHYFRKLYDPSLPEDAYEIFTDSDSIKEMNRRWAHLALAIAVMLALFALISSARLFYRPTLPAVIQTLTFVIESAVLLRGVFIMRNPLSSRGRRGDSAIITVFLTVIILSAVSSIALSQLRPSLWTNQQTDSIDEPIIDNRWVDFQVSYPDNYYLDLDIDASAPLTFAVVDEAGESMYSVTETAFHEQGIRMKLPRGTYSFSMSCESGFKLSCKID